MAHARRQNRQNPFASAQSVVPSGTSAIDAKQDHAADKQRFDDLKAQRDAKKDDQDGCCSCFGSLLVAVGLMKPKIIHPTDMKANPVRQQQPGAAKR